MNFSELTQLTDDQLRNQYSTFNATRFLLENSYGASDDQVKPVWDVVKAIQEEIDRRGLKNI